MQLPILINTFIVIFYATGAPILFDYAESISKSNGMATYKAPILFAFLSLTIKSLLKSLLKSPQIKLVSFWWKWRSLCCDLIENKNNQEPLHLLEAGNNRKSNTNPTQKQANINIFCATFQSFWIIKFK